MFAGLYPVESNQYDALRDALEKLKLNDSSLQYEPETSQALGFGFRCGFLGLLHLDIVQERLEREYGMDLITTAPTVVYQIVMRDGSIVEIENPSRMPDPSKVEEIREPIITATILVPQEYVGSVITLCMRPSGSSSRSPRRSCSAIPSRRSTPSSAARARHPHRDGRFRHRLFLAELPAAVPVRQDQDRPLVRERPREAGERPRSSGSHRARAQLSAWRPPPKGSRPRSSSPRRARWLHRNAGLPVLDAPAPPPFLPRCWRRRAAGCARCKPSRSPRAQLLRQQPEFSARGLFLRQISAISRLAFRALSGRATTWVSWRMPASIAISRQHRHAEAVVDHLHQRVQRGADHRRRAAQLGAVAGRRARAP